MVETRSRKRKRQRLISIASNVSSWPNVPARFESLNDDTLTTVLKFVGNKSYKSFGGLNYHCKEIYLNTDGMKKETFLYGYAPLTVIMEKYKRDGELDWEVFERVSKGVVLYNRHDVMEWALQEKDKLLLRFICNVAAEEGRIDLLDEVFNNIDYEDDKRDVFERVYCYAARGGQLEVLKWFETKRLHIDESVCTHQAASNGHLDILKWLREVKGFQLNGELYGSLYECGHFHILKWLKKQGCPWTEYTFRIAAEEGNLDILQWLHDEGCPWPDDEDYHRVYEYILKPEALAWLYSNGYHDRIM